MASIKNKFVPGEATTSTDHLDLAKARPAVLPNLKFSTEAISLRVPVSLLYAIKAEANRRDMPYQSLIKTALVDRFLPTPAGKSLAGRRL